jgi:excisionase family DNA binding protein
MQKKHSVATSAPIDPADLLTPEELAKRLKVGPWYIYNQIRQRSPHAMPHFKMGRYLRFSWKAVSAWLEARHRGWAA